MSDPAAGTIPPRTSLMASLEMRVLLWSVTLALLIGVVWMQRPEPPDAEAAARAAAGLGEIGPARADVVTIIAKIGMAMRPIQPPGVGAGGAPAVNPFLDMLDEQARFKAAGATGQPADVPGTAAYPAVERLRVAIVAGELLGPEGLLERLDKVEPQLDEDSTLIGDVGLLRALHADPTIPWPSRVVALDPAAVDGFRDRHGMFAGLALEQGAPAGATPVRDAAERSGVALLVVLLVFGGVVVLATLAGVVLLIVGLSRHAGGTLPLRFRKPSPLIDDLAPLVGQDLPKHPPLWTQVEPDRTRHTDFVLGPSPGWRDGVHRPTVHLETVAVFLAGFLGLKIISDLVAWLAAGPGGEPPAWLGPATLLGQWSLFGVIFWPLLRGMGWQRWRAEVGWHSGRGIGREIGAGLLGYLAGLPIYFGLAFMLVMGAFAYQYFMRGAGPGEYEPPASNPLFDLISSGGIWSMLLIFSLATVWAPFTEETIFRGALYRHLRRRVWVIPAALGSAFVFAVLHGYMAIQLALVGVLGFTFAMIREWRGSLIGPIFVHALHNGTVLTLLFTLLEIASA